MIDFFRKLFGHSGSSSTAKERLRLVLMTDHLELAPDMIEAMKRDLVDVISRYVEVDREKIDVTFEQQDKALAMLANIPILAVNRSGNGHAVAPVVAAAPVAATAPEDAASETPAGGTVEPETAVSETSGTGTVAAQKPDVDAPAATIPEVQNGEAVVDLKRRRRRRKKKMAGTQQPQEAAPAP